jgi:hypothetical protein
MQVPKATLDFFGSFHLSRVGPPPTWRRRVRTFSPTPCVGSPGRDPCQSRHADLRSGVLDLRAPSLARTWRLAPRGHATHISEHGVTRALCILLLWHVCSELSISQVTSRDSHHRQCPMSPPPEASSARRGCMRGCDILTSLYTSVECSLSARYD